MLLKTIFQIFIWEAVNPVILRIKKEKIYDFDSSYKGINLGCGLDTPEKWIGLDGGLSVFITYAFPLMTRIFFRFYNMSRIYTREEYVKKLRKTKIIHHDLTHSIPFGDRIIPAVYSSHFFEHLKKKEAERVAQECFRVMKPGGRIRICVPSLTEEVGKIKEAVRSYEKGDLTNIQKFVTQRAFGYQSAYGNHQWMYDFKEMQSLLSSAGFTDIREKEFRKGDMEDVEMLDTRGGLHVEAIKPI